MSPVDRILAAIAELQSDELEVLAHVAEGYSVHDAPTE